jgi:hypothetical protein
MSASRRANSLFDDDDDGPEHVELTINEEFASRLKVI